MNKTVLITGASSGFGEACALKFAASGHDLILVARREDRLQRLSRQLEGQCRVHTARVDVTRPETIETLFVNLPESFSAIDILVNNAGLALGTEPAYLADMSDWETMVETNIMGLLRLTRRVLPAMVERNTGHIINISSIAGSWPYPGGNVYGATKSFVQHFSRGLRADLLGKHIRVTNIDPGMAETDFSRVRYKGDADKADSVYENVKPLTATDIADIVHWVSSVPAHVNINTLEVMPVCQAWGALAVDRHMDDES